MDANKKLGISVGGTSNAEPLIKLPSMIIKELRAEIADQKMECDNKEAEIKRLQKFVDQKKELETKETEFFHLIY